MSPHPMTPRWLGPEETAAYVSARVDHLPRLVRKGVLPKPSLQFGPRSPRWDREQIDAMFGQSAASDSEAKMEAADAALRARLENRSTKARGRIHQGIPLRSKDPGASASLR